MEEDEDIEDRNVLVQGIDRKYRPVNYMRAGEYWTSVGSDIPLEGKYDSISVAIMGEAVLGHSPCWKLVKDEPNRYVSMFLREHEMERAKA